MKTIKDVIFIGYEKTLLLSNNNKALLHQKVLQKHFWEKLQKYFNNENIENYKDITIERFEKEIIPLLSLTIKV